MHLWRFLPLFLVSLILSLLVVRLARRVALRLDLIDYPQGRKNHTHPQPLGGGLAIYTVFALTIITTTIVFIFSDHDTQSRTTRLFSIADSEQLLEHSKFLLTILIGGTVIFLLGLIDDRRKIGISYKIKLSVQVFAGILLVATGAKIDYFSSPILNNCFTLAWVVGITNAFNLLDNMDGLSAGIAIIASLLFFTIALLVGELFIASLFILLTGVLSGFLIYNFYPARIFMGDTGSLFIGYTMSALSIKVSQILPVNDTLLPLVMPILVLSVPVFDTISVVAIRLHERRPLFIGDRRHFSHRLVELGMSQRGAVSFIYLVAAIGGMAAVLLQFLPLWGEFLMLTQTFLIFILLSVLMHSAKRKGLLHSRLPRQKVQSMEEHVS